MKHILILVLLFVALFAQVSFADEQATKAIEFTNDVTLARLFADDGVSTASIVGTADFVNTTTAVVAKTNSLPGDYVFVQPVSDSVDLGVLKGTCETTGSLTFTWDQASTGSLQYLWIQKKR
jgi:opacity protein-like surface antigen